jgi:hypothetical protein
MVFMGIVLEEMRIDVSTQVGCDGTLPSASGLDAGLSGLHKAPLRRRPHALRITVVQETRIARAGRDQDGVGNALRGVHVPRVARHGPMPA